MNTCCDCGKSFDKDGSYCPQCDETWETKEDILVFDGLDRTDSGDLF